MCLAWHSQRGKSEIRRTDAESNPKSEGPRAESNPNAELGPLLDSVLLLPKFLGGVNGLRPDIAKFDGVAVVLKHEEAGLGFAAAVAFGHEVGGDFGAVDYFDAV